MATRRSTSQRKRPTTAPLVGAAPSAGEGGREASSVSATDPQDMARQVLSDLDGALRQDPAVDEKDREALIDLFSTSLREVVDSGAYAKAPTESEWQANIEVLKQYDLESVSDNGSLARQMAGAVAKLEQQQTKVAIEFSRRMQADGQESALAWLKEQRESSADAEQDATQSPLNPSAIPTLRDEVTRSKSRRLRGPPK